MVSREKQSRETIRVTVTGPLKKKQLGLPRCPLGPLPTEGAGVGAPVKRPVCAPVQFGLQSRGARFNHYRHGNHSV